MDGCVETELMSQESPCHTQKGVWLDHAPGEAADQVRMGSVLYKLGTFIWPVIVQGAVWNLLLYVSDFKRG